MLAFVSEDNRSEATGRAPGRRTALRRTHRGLVRNERIITRVGGWVIMGWTSSRVNSCLAILGLVTVSVTSTEGWAQKLPPASFVPGEVLVKFKTGIAAEKMSAVAATARLQSVRHFASIGVHCYRIPAGGDVAATVRLCEADSSVAYAEPNYIYTASRLPNDPRFPELWALQNPNGIDIGAPKAWDVQTGVPGIRVAIIDTGVDYTHADLQANMWHNPGESGGGREHNGVDDDANGFVDDVFGWDFAGKDSDPKDDNGHGSHVAGTIAATGDNHVGVVGVNWRASIMACKFLTANGSGSASDAIEAILYAAENGARVANNSWGGGGFSQALRDAIEFARQKNVIFVAAAGNEGNDNDLTPSYPASYDVANVVAVAAHDRAGQMASFSNFGKTSVDLAAPGVDILSSTPGNAYQVFSGTSMATPHVSGVAALLIAQNQSLTYRQVLVRIAGSVDAAAAFENTTWSGGRLNAAAALAATPKVAFVTRLAATTDTTGPYRVDAEATGDSPVTEAFLSYAVAGDTPRKVPMRSVAVDTYRAEIPGQALGSSVSYFVDVADAARNSTRSRTYAFQVGPPGGAPGCGNFASTTATSLRSRILATLANSLLLVGSVLGARKLWTARHTQATAKR